MPYSAKGFFEINEDMVQFLLMLEVLFTQDSKVEDLFCGASSGSEPSLFFSNYFFSLGFQPIQDDFQHDFARMTDKADSSVVLAELQVALFRECNNQRLSPWGRPFSIFCYRSLLEHLSWSPRQLEQVLLVYYQLRQTSPFSVMLLQSQLPHGGLVADLLPGASCSPVQCCLDNSHSCTVLSNILSIC